MSTLICTTDTEDILDAVVDFYRGKNLTEIQRGYDCDTGWYIRERECELEFILSTILIFRNRDMELWYHSDGKGDIDWSKLVRLVLLDPETFDRSDYVFESRPEGWDTNE